MRKKRIVYMEGPGTMRLDTGYLRWLMDYVHVYEHMEYAWIVELLGSCPFHWDIWLDENANAHGLTLRHLYFQHTGLAPLVLPNNPEQASLLEVMIVAASRLEETCYYDPDFDGSYRWFWQEFFNVGFQDCKNSEEVFMLVDRLLGRMYDPNGAGSMTGPIENPKEDIRMMPFLQQIRVWNMHQTWKNYC